MARIPALPSLEIIRGLKGILDFYVWRGLPCVRAWPKYRPAKQTAPSLAAALLFGAIIKAYSLVGSIALETYRELAVGIPRTARDIMVTGVYGNLHEASMSDFLTLLTECRDYLLALTDLLDTLHSVGTDFLEVHVHATVLPPDAATNTGQGQLLMPLLKIDDLQDALESKALDRLIVRGDDQLFSFKGVLAVSRTAVISGAGGFVDSDPCAAGEIWVVTNIEAYDSTSATTGHLQTVLHDAVGIGLGFPEAALAAGKATFWSGQTWLDPSDTIRIYFAGGLIADSCTVRIAGFRMTLET